MVLILLAMLPCTHRSPFARWQQLHWLLEDAATVTNSLSSCWTERLLGPSSRQVESIYGVALEDRSLLYKLHRFSKQCIGPLAFSQNVSTKCWSVLVKKKEAIVCTGNCSQLKFAKSRWRQCAYSVSTYQVCTRKGLKLTRKPTIFCEKCVLLKLINLELFLQTKCYTDYKLHIINSSGTMGMFVFYQRVSSFHRWKVDYSFKRD